MKINLWFKTPDVLDQVDKDIYQEFKELFDKYLKYSAYVMIEFDTETGTCIVKEQR